MPHGQLAANDVLDHFTGDHDFLSNFAPYPVRLSGLDFPTAEAAFQACKTLDPAERARIAQARTPGHAKQLGRRLALRPEWTSVHRYAAMRQVLAAKFTDTALAERLARTGAALLIEGNRHHDDHWVPAAARGIAAFRGRTGWAAR